MWKVFNRSAIACLAALALLMSTMTAQSYAQDNGCDANGVCGFVVPNPNDQDPMSGGGNTNNGHNQPTIDSILNTHGQLNKNQIAILLGNVRWNVQNKSGRNIAVMQTKGNKVTWQDSNNFLNGQWSIQGNGTTCFNYPNQKACFTLHGRRGSVEIQLNGTTYYKLSRGNWLK